MVVIYVSSNALLRGETRLTIIPNYKKERSFRSLLQACLIIFVVSLCINEYGLGNSILVLIDTSGSIAVVVTPLTTLMLDQKKKFTDLEIIAEFVGGAQDDKAAVAAVIQGKVQLVYISPESIIGNKKFRSIFQKDVCQEHLFALVIDEAHCVKLWYVCNLYEVLMIC